MLKIKIKLFLGLLFCLCCWGCGDSEVHLEGLLAAPEALTEGVIGPVPEHIKEICWGADVDTLMTALKYVINIDADGFYIKPDGTRVYDPNGIAADALIHQICLRREQEAYYTKYISAGGIAIMGNGYLDDRFFYAARDIVLGMTQKRPELRAALTPSRENRPGATQNPPQHDITGLLTPSRRYRIILEDPALGVSVVPENHMYNNTYNYPILSVGSNFSTRSRVLVNKDLLYKVLSHEFAHAIHLAINLLDTTFDKRLEAAYAEALAYAEAADMPASYFSKGYYGLKNKKEFWAESASFWFEHLARNHLRGDEHVVNIFRASYPLMYDLLDEWFDILHLDTLRNNNWEVSE